MCQFVEFWETLSRDSWIISNVREGCKINFINTPFQTTAGRNMVMGEIQRNICDGDIQALLIETVVDSTEGFISGRSGGYRPIVNLKSLNKFVRTEHFKMEGISSVISLKST